MKKILALVLALVMVFALAACGQQGGSSASADVPAGFEQMADLIAAAKAEGELVVYGSCEEEYLSAVCAHFEELFGMVMRNEIIDAKTVIAVSKAKLWLEGQK